MRSILVTDAGAFLGPGVVSHFEAEGYRVHAVVEPLRTRADVDAVLERIGGVPDVVVANLDTPIAVSPVRSLDPGEWAEAFDALVHPLFHLLQAVLPAMVERGSGSIVVPTSATATRASSHPISAYATARAAQNQLVRSAAREVAAAGVRINAVAPNFIENPSYFPPETVADPAFQGEMKQVVPAERLGSPDEAAAVVGWLASPAASYVVGAIVPVDGGWTL